MEIRKIYLKPLIKKTKEFQKEEMPLNERQDISDLWQNLDSEGIEALKKEIGDIGKVKPIGKHPASN